MRMILDRLDGLLEREKITFPQYQAELAAIRKEAREAESLSSPQWEAEKSPGVVKTQQEVPVKDVSSLYPDVVKSEVVEESGHESCVKRDVVKNETVKSGVRKAKRGQARLQTAVQSEVSGIPLPLPKAKVSCELKVEGRSETVVDGRKDQSTEKELDWNIVNGKKSSSTAKMQQSTEGGKSAEGKPSPLPRNSVPEGENYSRKGAQVPVEKAAIVKQKVLASQEAPVMRAIGGAATGNGAAVGQTWSVVEDGQTWRCETQISAEGHSRMCDAEDFIPLVGAGATKGSNGHVLVVGTSKRGHVQVGSLLCGGIYKPNPNAGLVLMGRKFSGVSGGAWGTWNWAKKKLCATASHRVEHGHLMRPHKQLTKMGVVTCRRGRKMQVLEVRVVWCLEDELAKTQIDAVNTDVINKESARPWSVEGEVLCVSYPVLGIYFGRRR